MVITEIVGPTQELLAASDQLAAEFDRRDGLLLRLRGATPEGIVVVNVWISPAARSAALDDERHARARATSRIPDLEISQRSMVVHDVRIDRLT